MDYSLPGSSVHGILQAGILEWDVCPPPEDLLDPGIELWSLAGMFFTTRTAWEAHSQLYFNKINLKNLLLEW